MKWSRLFVLQPKITSLVFKSRSRNSSLCSRVTSLHLTAKVGLWLKTTGTRSGSCAGSPLMVLLPKGQAESVDQGIVSVWCSLRAYLKPTSWFDDPAELPSGVHVPFFQNLSSLRWAYSRHVSHLSQKGVQGGCHEGCTEPELRVSALQSVGHSRKWEEKGSGLESISSFWFRTFQNLIPTCFSVPQAYLFIRRMGTYFT